MEGWVNGMRRSVKQFPFDADIYTNCCRSMPMFGSQIFGSTSVLLSIHLSTNACYHNDNCIVQSYTISHSPTCRVYILVLLNVNKYNLRCRWHLDKAKQLSGCVCRSELVEHTHTHTHTYDYIEKHRRRQAMI